MRIMAIDYGDARTGVAVSDALGMLAGFTTVIHSRSQDEVVAQLKALTREHGVEELALGWPKNMDASLGERAQLCQALAERLNAFYGRHL